MTPLCQTLQVQKYQSKMLSQCHINNLQGAVGVQANLDLSIFAKRQSVGMPVTWQGSAPARPILLTSSSSPHQLFAVAMECPSSFPSCLSLDILDTPCSLISDAKAHHFRHPSASKVIKSGTCSHRTLGGRVRLVRWVLHDVSGFVVSSSMKVSLVIIL